MTKFIPCCKTSSSSDLAQLFLDFVWKSFGHPASIVFSCDSCFVGHFWHSLWKIFGTSINFSTIFHPYIDGQTEVVNYTFLPIPQIYHHTSPTKWDLSLTHIENAYNRAVHSSISHSLFEIYLGFQPLAPYEFPLSLPSPTTS